MLADTDPRNPATERRDLSRAVAADLEEIFKDVAVPPAAAPGRVRTFIGLAARPNARSPARIGALLAAVLVGVSVGAAIVNPPGGSRSINAPGARVRPAAAPAPQRLAVEIAPAAPIALPVTVAAAPAAAPPVRVTRVRAPAAARHAPARPSTAKAVVRARPVGCARLQGDARARCAYPAVLAADRRLRQAYSSATRAGVSRPVLVSYRNRWANLRRQATHEPRRVIDGYGVMARDLTRMARDARGRRS
jgi:hypothetical protein